MFIIYDIEDFKSLEDSDYVFSLPITNTFNNYPLHLTKKEFLKKQVILSKITLQNEKIK